MPSRPLCLPPLHEFLYPAITFAATAIAATAATAVAATAVSIISTVAIAATAFTVSTATFAVVAVSTATFTALPLVPTLCATPNGFNRRSCASNRRATRPGHCWRRGIIC